MSDVIPCPYCASTDDCPHLLLLVDKTFRAAVGGSLMDAFNEHWFEICETGGNDFDEREPFDGLLDQVHGLADDFNEYDVDGGPGSFCEYAVYFSKSKDSRMTAMQIFSWKILGS
jgi:hypothetical protein